MAFLLQSVVRGRARRILQSLPSCIQAASDESVGFSGRHPIPTTLNRLPAQQWTPVRGFSEELRVVASPLTEPEYHHAAEETLEAMVEKLEAFVEENDVDGGDVEYSQGVLTVKLGKHGTFVMNKQTPNRQIWLSSPVSGPFRFDHVNGRWVYSRDGRELVRQLEQEIGTLVGAQLKL